MKKYGIINKATGEVLRYKKDFNENYVFSLDPKDPLFLIDKIYLVETAMKPDGNGSFYSPRTPNHLQGVALEIVEVETKVVVSKITPLISKKAA